MQEVELWLSNTITSSLDQVQVVVRLPVDLLKILPDIKSR